MRSSAYADTRACVRVGGSPRRAGGRGMPSKGAVLEPDWPLAVWIRERRICMTSMYRSGERPISLFNSVGWFEGSAFVSVDFDVEDVILEE